MNFFDYIKNDAFFKPLTLKYRRVYYDCIQILIDKTKELPVLYESDAKDSITAYLKNAGINEVKKDISSDINAVEEIEAGESGTELQSSGILSLGRLFTIYVGTMEVREFWQIGFLKVWN